MNKPFISLIIPVYNVEYYIQECLDSILKWNFGAWEVVLIDDESPDKCGAICDNYASRDSRIKVIHQKNGGVSIARNAGLDVARGEWCWFVDPDDVIDYRIPVVFELLKDKDLVIFDIKIFQDGNNLPLIDESYSFEVCENLDTFYKKFISYTHPTHWYHRKFWGKEGEYVIRFTQGIKLGEDLEFMRKCELLAKRPLKINHTNYYYRIREGSAFHKEGIEQQTIEDSFKVLFNLYKFISNYHIVPIDGMLQRFTNLVTTIPVYALKAGLWSKSVRKKFRQIVALYEKSGMRLTKSRYVWLAFHTPHILSLITSLKSIVKIK